MHLRLRDETVLSMPTFVCEIYLALESQAAGRDVIYVSLNQIPVNKSQDRIRRAFYHLRDCGLSIEYDRTQHKWRIAWPNGVDLHDLLENLRKLEAGQAYFINVDTLMNLRRTCPDADPEVFTTAVESALISAHGSHVKQRNLQRWLRHGVRQEVQHASRNSNTDAQTTHNTQNQDKSESFQEWRERMAQADRNRPDLEKLYGKVPEIMKP